MSQSTDGGSHADGWRPARIGSGAAQLRRAAAEMEEWLATLSQVRGRAMNGCSGTSAGAVEAIARWADAIGTCGDDTTQQLKALGLLATGTAAEFPPRLFNPPSIGLF